VPRVCVPSLLLIAACASSSGLENNLIEGGPGQAITVEINAVDNSNTLRDPDKSRQYAIEVEVGNSSDTLVTVTQISITTDGSGAFQVYPTVKRFNELIDPHKAPLFRIDLRGRLMRPFAMNEAHTVVLRVIATLSNGDAYAYSFEGPVREAD